MAYKRKYTSKTTSTGRRKKSTRRTAYKNRQPTTGRWSNTVGTRGRSDYWRNPTIGGGTKILNARNTFNDWDALTSLKVVANPFSDATQQPRFPDGKASESIGFRGQMIGEFTQKDTTVCDILFFAGLNTCLVLEGVDASGLTTAQNVPEVKHMSLQRHGRGTIDATAKTITQNDSTMIAKWRPVSYGLHVSLVNNSDENDGWWEAVRMTPTTDGSAYTLADLLEGGFTEPDQAVTVLHNVPDLASSQMLANQSYSTGKLRNIHNVLFNLNPEMKEHEFNDLPKVLEFPSLGVAVSDGTVGIDQTITQGTNNYPVGNSTALHSPVHAYVDTSYDMIFIRLHGRPASGGREASRFTCHTVMNQELIYDEKSENVKFHQITSKTPLTANIKTGNSAAKHTDMEGVEGGV